MTRTGQKNTPGTFFQITWNVSIVDVWCLRRAWAEERKLLIQLGCKPRLSDYLMKCIDREGWSALLIAEQNSIHYFPPLPISTGVPQRYGIKDTNTSTPQNQQEKALFLWVCLCLYGTVLVILARHDDSAILSCSRSHTGARDKLTACSRLQVLSWCSASCSRVFSHLDCRGPNQSREWPPFAATNPF